MEYRKHSRLLRHLLSIPFIYLMIVPLVLLDLFMELYHRVCFPLYGIKTVSRGKYIVIDRHKLKYLNSVERINCTYCGYANGLMAYAGEIAARTEAYWCGIAHEKRKGRVEQPHQKKFVKYGDEKSLKKRYPE